MAKYHLKYVEKIHATHQVVIETDDPDDIDLDNVPFNLISEDVVDRYEVDVEPASDDEPLTPMKLAQLFFIGHDDFDLFVVAFDKGHATQLWREYYEINGVPEKIALIPATPTDLKPRALEWEELWQATSTN